MSKEIKEDDIDKKISSHIDKKIIAGEEVPTSIIVNRVIDILNKR